MLAMREQPCKGEAAAWANDTLSFFISIYYRNENKKAHYTERVALLYHN